MLARGFRRGSGIIDRGEQLGIIKIRGFCGCFRVVVARLLFGGLDRFVKEIYRGIGFEEFCNGRLEPPIFLFITI